MGVLVLSVRAAVQTPSKKANKNLVIAGLTRNPLDIAYYSWDCGSWAAMTGWVPKSIQYYSRIRADSSLSAMLYAASWNPKKGSPKCGF